MGVIGGELGYQILRRVNRMALAQCDGSAYNDRSKLEVLLGPKIWEELKDRVVLDFGCGEGEDAVEVARRCARKVIGVDLRENVLDLARNRAAEAGLSGKCVFTTHTEKTADVILSIDAFEHFSERAAVLKIMRRLVKPDGCVIAAFGPTWYHPLGGHLFSVFPWSHLVFTENALIRWRSDFKTDGARKFGEVEGGLNQMTINRFERLIHESDFRFGSFEPVPIRKLRMLSNRMTREFTTAIVRCKLVPR
jgi:SAM-dependent methyltransferase